MVVRNWMASLRHRLSLEPTRKSRQRPKIRFTPASPEALEPRSLMTVGLGVGENLTGPPAFTFDVPQPTSPQTGTPAQTVAFGAAAPSAAQAPLYTTEAAHSASASPDLGHQIDTDTLGIGTLVGPPIPGSVAAVADFVRNQASSASSGSGDFVKSQAVASLGHEGYSGSGPNWQKLGDTTSKSQSQRPQTTLPNSHESGYLATGPSSYDASSPDDHSQKPKTQDPRPNSQAPRPKSQVRRPEFSRIRLRAKSKRFVAATCRARACVQPDVCQRLDERLQLRLVGAKRHSSAAVSRPPRPRQPAKPIGVRQHAVRFIAPPATNDGPRTTDQSARRRLDGR